MNLRAIFWGRHSITAWVIELLCFVPFLLAAIFSRAVRRPFDVGLGPEPLVNNVYHKKALENYGYSAETFVYNANFITDQYDFNLGKKRMDLLPPIWRPLYLFWRVLFRYRSLFIYFNGGPLFSTNWLFRFEPFFYKLAGIKVVVMPYGSDVQDMIHSRNLYFRHVMSMDYPEQFRKYKRVSANIDRWTHNADWIITGVEWVDYMYHWHTLLLAHFSIDCEQRWQPSGKAPVIPERFTAERPLRILHAPNHKAIKGTKSLIEAVDRLKAEGVPVELVIMQKVPNTQIQEVMESVDMVADQFVVGWYAMFAIEAMSLEKPVLCYLREDLIELYTKAGLVKPGEIPLINTSLLTIADQIRWAVSNPAELRERGKRGREYVINHHSTTRIGREFATILENLRILPARQSGLERHGVSRPPLVEASG